MRTRPLLTAVAGLGLAAGLLPALSPAGAAGERRVPTPPEAASRALVAAQRVLGGDARPTRDATMALRDLVLQRGALTGAERATADRLLARPAATRRACTPRICVHWRPRDVARADRNDNGVPDYVDSVRRTVDRVHTTYRRAGYRPPKRDGRRGGDERTDIYLADVGSRGLYGYCTSDQERFGRGFDIWAYCVLDNDYSSRQFPTNTPRQNMQVTAAHEYFHAVQFGYDATEDAWLMESTATWVEDEVFDRVDDNVQYLPEGPMSRPRVPMDKVTGLHFYGVWIFFRHLTERYAAERGALPRLVLDVWRRADASPGAPDRYSLQAIEEALAARGTTLREQFARFSDANLRPADTYEEGAANNYPATPPWTSRALSPDSPSANAQLRLDHLTSATARVRPDGIAADWELEVVLDLPPRRRGSAAVVTVNGTDGSADTTLVPLARDGDGSVTVPFSSSTVGSVDVTLVNASRRMRDCGGRTAYSCDGRSRDDDLRHALKVTAAGPAG